MTVAEMQERALALLKGLPEERLRSALDYLEYLQAKGDADGEECDMEDLTASIKQGLEELALYKAGKLKVRTFQKLLDELEPDSAP